MADNLRPLVQGLVDAVAASLASQKTPEFCRLTQVDLSDGAAVLVCTSLSEAEALARVNQVPGATSREWRLTEVAEAAPKPCPDDPSTHRHLVFETATPESSDRLRRNRA